MNGGKGRPSKEPTRQAAQCPEASGTGRIFRPGAEGGPSWGLRNPREKAAPTLVNHTLGMHLPHSCPPLPASSWENRPGVHHAPPRGAAADVAADRGRVSCASTWTSSSLRAFAPAVSSARILVSGIYKDLPTGFTKVAFSGSLQGPVFEMAHLALPPFASPKHLSPCN